MSPEPRGPRDHLHRQCAGTTRKFGIEGHGARRCAPCGPFSQSRRTRSGVGTCRACSRPARMDEGLRSQPRRSQLSRSCSYAQYASGYRRPSLVKRRREHRRRGDREPVISDHQGSLLSRPAANGRRDGRPLRKRVRSWAYRCRSPLFFGLLNMFDFWNIVPAHAIGGDTGQAMARRPV